MLLYISATVAFWTICALLSMVAQKDRPWIESPLFVPASLVVLFLGFAIVIGGSAAAAGSTPPVGAAFAVGAAVPGIFLLVPWLHHVIGRATGAAQRAALGIDNMKISRTYDAAEKLMSERRFGEAERAFLAEGEADGEEPEPLRRAGDAALAAGRAGDAVRHFLRALERKMPDEDRAALGFHVAEIQERELGRADEARRTLLRVKELLAATRFAAFADERLGRLDRPPVSS
jgi:TolA-binding protein